MPRTYLLIELYLFLWELQIALDVWCCCTVYFDDVYILREQVALALIIFLLQDYPEFLRMIPNIFCNLLASSSPN